MGGPVQSRSRGVRIADASLHLALLDETHAKDGWLHELEAEYEATRNSHPTWPTWQAIRQGEETHYQALEDYLRQHGIDAAELAKIRTLSLGADRDVYNWIFFYWWKTSPNHFVIDDLSHLKVCANLQRLELDAVLCRGTSLKGLAKLPSLEALIIDAKATPKDIDALAKIPRLRSLEVLNLDESLQQDQWEAVFAQLRKQGLPSLIRG